MEKNKIYLLIKSLLLKKIQFFQFLLIGGFGVFLNLFTIFILTEFILGINNYFYSYLFGLFINFIFNFYFYLKLFKKGYKNKIFIIFLLYTITYLLILSFLVYFIVELVGRVYYLYVISILIFLFSIINFFVFKFIIFKKY